MPTSRPSPTKRRASDSPDQASQTLSEVRQQIIGCSRCTRLRTYCQRIATEKKAAYREEVYWGRPVPGFGDREARVLVIGLAPAAHGANRTGRVFTGDGPLGSGDFLMRAMHAHGFASIPTARTADDGMILSDAFIAAAVRCAPPDNKPTPDRRRCRASRSSSGSAASALTPPGVCSRTVASSSNHVRRSDTAWSTKQLATASSVRITRAGRIRTPAS